MTDHEYDPKTLEEPGEFERAQEPNIWMRGLFMILFAILFGVGEFVLSVGAVLQFFWMLIRKERNPHIVRFGEDLSDWLARVARFQTGATEDKPFPFAPWGPAR